MSEKAKYKTKVIATRSLMAILGVVFGILITAQWRSIPSRVTNPIAPYQSLKETKADLTNEQNNLKNNIKDLQKSIEKIQKDSENISLTKSEISELQSKKAQAGLTRLNGPGVIVVLDDSKKGAATEDSIIHAADLRDVINLLWGSGAEAISINNQRIVINSAIDCIVNTVLVNDVRLSTPFRIEAIGNRSMMYDRLTSGNFLTNLHQRQRDQGIIFDISTNNDITTPTFDGSFEIKSGGSN